MLPDKLRRYQNSLLHYAAPDDRAAALTGLKWLALAAIVIGGAVAWALVLR